MKKQSTFALIWTEHPVYLNYEEIEEDKRGTVIPLVLMLNRWDGKIGFIGGNVDENETLEQATIREIKEEANFDINEKHVLEYVCQHENEKKINHLFSLNLNFNDFKSIIQNQHEAVHFISEGTIFATQFINYSHCKTFDNFMKHNFAINVKEEIETFIQKQQWDKKYLNY